MISAWSSLPLLKKKQEKALKCDFCSIGWEVQKERRRLSINLRTQMLIYAFCHVPKPPFLFYTLQVRNHRKITVIDGKMGYVGGFNIGKEYINLDPILNPWRDYHLKIQGEGVQDLQQIFFKIGKNPNIFPMQKKSTLFSTVRERNLSPSFLCVRRLSPRRYLFYLIRSAEHSILIGTPYFIPGKRSFMNYCGGAKRG